MFDDVVAYLFEESGVHRVALLGDVLAGVLKSEYVFPWNVLELCEGR